MYIISLKKLWKIQHAYSAPTSYHFTTLWPPQYVYYAKYIRTNENNVKAANYIYIKYQYSREGMECEAAARKKKQIPPHCPQDNNLNSRPQGQLGKFRKFRTLLTVGLTRHCWPVYIYNRMQAAIQSILWASAERFKTQEQMSLFYWLLLIAAISLTESIITSTGRRQQISNVPQNTTTHTNNENQEETSLQLPRVKRQTVETLKKFINITQAIPVKTVYIPVRMHQFNKMIPFQQVYSQITN